MSIQNKGSIIKSARNKANLTQEQISEGICSVETLAQVERGLLPLGASYFEALMSRSGSSSSAYPCYKSRNEFDCFYTLKRALFYINSWQLKEAYDELHFVETQKWAENKFYYAEWILLHGKLQFLSGCCNHKENYSFLLHGLKLTSPTLNLLDFGKHLFSITELEFLLLLAEESLYLEDNIDCFTICSQIEQYLSQTHITYLDKERLQAQTAVVLGKYHIATNDYDTALSILEPHRHQMAVNSEDLQLLRLTFLKGLSLYKRDKNEDSLRVLKTALYSAHAIDSCYATICANYLKENTDIDMDSLFPLPLLELTKYETKYHILLPEQHFDIPPTPIYLSYLSLGEIMKQLREEQHLSQEIICQGLCNKSTLSKIEHNRMQPDIFLTEALLQRLGISERPFEFYGNKQEHDFYTLKFKSMNTQLLGNEFLVDIISRLEKITSQKNIVQKQILRLSQAPLCPTAEEKIQMYFDSLTYTLPHFDIARIHEFRLSWAELTILNNIAHLYIKTDTPTKSIYYFNQLESYYHAACPSILLKKNVYVPMIEMYCHVLYNQKHFKDINLFHNMHTDLMKSNSNFYSFFLFYYSQSLGECGKYELANILGNYACALSKMHCLHNNARCLKRYFKEDFDIDLIEF